MFKPWELYYRGTIGKWVELCKNKHKSKVDSGLFKDYLELKLKIEEDLIKINNLEIEVTKKYPLLKSVPLPSNPEESKIFLEELFVYINSKKT
jgi:hypothetical protein